MTGTMTAQALHDIREFFARCGFEQSTIQGERFNVLPAESEDYIESGYAFGEVQVRAYEDGSRNAAWKMSILRQEHIEDVCQRVIDWIHERAATRAEA